MLTAILVPPADSSAPVLEPTSATLQTDRGPVELSVAMASNSEHDTPWGTTRLDLFLPSLEPGTYRAEFLDLVDASGAWRFGIGRVVIRIDPGTGPADLERLGGTIESNADEGGSVQGFDLLVLNVADAPVEVTGVSTDIPGLPVSWVLLDPAARQVIDAVAIPPGTEARVTAGTDSDAGPVAFVQATPELVYRVGDAQRRMLVDPILFTNGFGVPADVTAYRETLPATSCAARI